MNRSPKSLLIRTRELPRLQASIACLCAVLSAGCVSKSKAKAQAQAAYLAGQQQAMARMQMQQPRGQGQVVTVVGQVQNGIVPWTEEMTVAKAVVAAGYAGGDPKQIFVVRGGQAIPIDPGQLLTGSDIPLLPGDIVQINQ
ncbi:MAG TPA: hypothetical protein VLT36_09400 [Candidatus Dormibacteraeota bacterium]|nr:hypothetical protein [Candidatus Dormibacteraeota bacterium]